MKKLLLTIAVLAIVALIGVFGQALPIISENFQEWEPTEDPVPDTCKAGYVMEYDITRPLTIETSSGDEEIQARLYQVVIRPECDSRRIDDDPSGNTKNLPGVTTGWVMLNKLTDGDPDFDLFTVTMENMDESPDTLGEFIFGPIPQIDSIVFAHSNTGSKRGIRVYKSTDGESWENASPEDEFWDGDDCQLGDVNTVIINETDVYIKFTSGFKMSDSTSQFTRLHNIDVYGTPGELSSINNIKTDMLSVYPVPASNTINIKIPTQLINSHIHVYNILGELIYTEAIKEKTTRIPVRSWSAGIYLIQLSNGKESITKQFIIN
jgi:hypothetical protein